MLKDIFDQLTGKTFIRNAQNLFAETAAEIENLKKEIPLLEGHTLREAKARLSLLESRWSTLDNWFTEYNYPKVPKATKVRGSVQA